MKDDFVAEQLDDSILREVALVHNIFSIP